MKSTESLGPASIPICCFKTFKTLGQEYCEILRDIASKETWHELPISFKKAKRHRVKSYSGHVRGRWLPWSTLVLHGSSPSNIHIRLAGDLLGQGNSSFCLLQWSFREGWFLGGELEMVTLDFSVSWPNKKSRKRYLFVKFNMASHCGAWAEVISCPLLCCRFPATVPSSTEITSGLAA